MSYPTTIDTIEIVTLYTDNEDLLYVFGREDGEDFDISSKNIMCVESYALDNDEVSELTEEEYKARVELLDTVKSWLRVKPNAIIKIRQLTK